MALTTFGAIMGFAAGMAAKTCEYYKELAARATDAGLKGSIEELAREEAKTRTRLEEMRRLNVTEMILEYVSGLHDEDYDIKVDVSGSAGDKRVLEATVALEEREKRFFSDASDKVPLPEVARYFRKMAAKKEQSLSRLKEQSPH
jgi:rubrerythrin